MPEGTLKHPHALTLSGATAERFTVFRHCLNFIVNQPMESSYEVV